MATLHASGNGATNIVFRVKDGEIYLVQTIRDGSDEWNEWFTLEPGSYELTFVTSGAGQALPEGGGSPAFGSFAGSIEFPTAAVVAPWESAKGERLVPTVVPNPLRSTALIMPAAGGCAHHDEIIVFDLSGRMVRRFPDVGPAGVSWDARDMDGRQVPSGSYVLRGGNGGATQVVVLR